MTFTTWLGISLDEITERLYKQHKVHRNSLLLITKQIACLDINLRDDFKRFWETGEAASKLEIGGWSLKRLMDEERSSGLNAFLIVNDFLADEKNIDLWLNRKCDDIIFGIKEPPVEFPFKTWLGVTQNELADGLVNRFGVSHPDVVPQQVYKFGDMIFSKLKDDFARFWKTGIPESSIEIEGWSVNRLIENHMSGPTGAFSTMLWLERDPKEAAAALKYGIR